MSIDVIYVFPSKGSGWTEDFARKGCLPAILPVGSRVLLDVETTDPYLIVSYFWDETWGKLLCYVGESESESEVFDFGLCKYEGICEDMEKDGWYPFEKFLSKTPPV